MDRNRSLSLIEEAAKWRLVSLLLECPRAGWLTEAQALAVEVDDDRLKLAVELARNEADEGTYHSIFGPGGPAPPREITYRSWAQPGYLLSELSAYYSAFSYGPSIADVPDHIAVETGFVAYLKLKEAYAYDSGDAAAAAVSAEAATAFVKDHLSKFAGTLAGELGHSGVEYLGLAGRLLIDLVGRGHDEDRNPLPVIQGTNEEFFECGAVD